MTDNTLRRILYTLIALAMILNVVSFAAKQYPEFMGICKVNPTSNSKCIIKE